MSRSWRGVNAIRLYPGNHRSGNGMHLATRTENGIHSVRMHRMTEVGRWNVRVLIIVKGSNLGVEIGTPLVERCLVNTLLKSLQLSVALFPFSPIYSSRGFVTWIRHV